VLGERFVELLDELPMRYCASWRMRMAANMLREAGAVTGEDGQLAQPSRIRFRKPDLARLASRAFGRLPTDPVGRARKWPFRWDSADLSLNAFVDDLATVVDAAQVEQFDLLGISQGAAVAVVYSLRYPERIRRTVLLGGYAAGWRARRQ
jgi:pimeloyl-ACP methyl ester carboxylesterase